MPIRNKKVRKKYMRKWREDHPDYDKIEYRKRIGYKKKWKKDNSDKMKSYREKWNRENPKYNNQYHKDRRRIDVRFNLNYKMSKAICESLKGNKSGKHWETLVGYSLNELIGHLEKTIPKGYTWQDFLGGKLHIDHKIPISAFNYTEPEHTDFKKCWALENLQLLPAKENWAKSNKLQKPFQPALKITSFTK